MITKKFSLFVAGYVLGLTALACVGYLYADFSIKAERSQRVEEQRFRSDLAYVNLPRMNLTLSSSAGHQTGRVRIDLSLAVEKQYVGRMEDVEPRIAERIVGYIRQVDFDDISQPTATKWLRKRVLEEATNASSPLPIVDVVFNQLVIM
jgi:flagellar basal body-associated protein FliL